MKHTAASTLYQQERAKLPEHEMHVHARMLVTMYLQGRYAELALSHKGKLARALHNMDGALVALREESEL